MPINSEHVMVGRADQTTTGAILSGAVITDVPADIASALSAISGFTSSGYVGDDGVTLAQSISTKGIKEWNGATVRKVIEKFDGTIKFKLIQTDYEGWCQAVGAENVIRTPATDKHGEQLHIKLGTHLPKNQAFALKLKDGDQRMLVLIPDGQVTDCADISFKATEPIPLEVTVTAYDDGTGNGDAIHIFTDDGKVSA